MYLNGKVWEYKIPLLAQLNEIQNIQDGRINNKAYDSLDCMYKQGKGMLESFQIMLAV
jgi:hypothetical protein